MVRQPLQNLKIGPVRHNTEMKRALSRDPSGYHMPFLDLANNPVT